ncbi:MAG: tyrosine-type recombinase/integrase [Planctomycetales bacterium]
MASISKDPKGNRSIQFVGKDRKRRTVRIGKCSQRQAEAVKVHVERLVHACITGHPVDPDTARWLVSIDDKLADRLAAVGLTEKRDASTLAAFLDSYIAARTDVKPGTKMLYGQTRRNLLAFFPEDKQLSAFTLGDADAWRLFLKEQGLAENTIRRRCGRAKQFFNAAVRRKLVGENPFADLKSNVMGNPEKFYFVTPEEISRVFEACPDAQWRMIFALSRYAGMRCPSEHLRLKWSDIDWANGRIHITSPKTEHHIGGESRVAPLFPELLPFLRDCFEQAEDGTEFVITRYREATQNLGTQGKRIVRQAGLKPWPKLFQNLRSTRETELAEDYPMHVVCAWIGNSQPIAAKHYLQVTDAHFARAVECPESSEASALQNPVQQPHETNGNGSQVVNTAQKETPTFAGDFSSLRRDAVNISYPART